ncbi:MAG: bifunctional phosphopantothenoylcysteine decarboxylase/phosphopantothenate--cysteine ligase CoaBC [Dehalococcoidia bacterium]
MVEGKKAVLAVTGSISVYKIVDLASKLVQAGIEVDVAMTESATRFVAPISFRAVTHRPVHTDMWAPVTDFDIEHVALGERGDVVVVAPATANTIAKIAMGIADNLVTCTVLSTQSPVLIAPAMDVGMYLDQATQDNLEKLRQRGYIVVGPASGRLASGLEGSGRLVEVAELQTAIYKVLGRSGDLAGKHVVVTAGGTREPIDTVRYIGNYSSGKMGFAVAEAARNRGASVSLITGPADISPPLGVMVTRIQTAAQMRDAVMDNTPKADALIMAAAVADYRPESSAEAKIKRKAEGLSLQLVPTADIINEVQGSLIKVGFAAESEDLVKNAQGKLESKRLDLIVANDITASGSGFGSDTNKVTIINRAGETEDLPLMSKFEVANRILDRVAEPTP